MVIERIITSWFRLVDKKTDYWLLMFLFPLPSHSLLPTMHSLCAKLVLNTPWCSQLKQSRSIGGHGLQQNPNHGVTHTIIYSGFKLSKLLHILFIFFFWKFKYIFQFSDIEERDCEQCIQYCTSTSPSLSLKCAFYKAGKLFHFL